MIKAQSAAEPEVEDLLASIRKAITDEAGLAPAGTRPPAAGTVITGSMRELRVRPGDSAAGGSRAGEILELRNKISSQLGRKEEERAEGGRPAPANGFAGILGGDAPMMGKPAATEAGRNPPPAAAEPLRDSPARAEPPVYEPPFAAPAPVYHPAPEPREDPLARYADHARDWRTPLRYPQLADLRPDRGGFPADAAMMSQDSAAAASSAFNRLADTLMARATGERPIEEITRELLRSMLKQWLDEHLPALVERMVREEIERVARRGPLR